MLFVPLREFPPFHTPTGCSKDRALCCTESLTHIKWPWCSGNTRASKRLSANHQGPNKTSSEHAPTKASNERIDQGHGTKRQGDIRATKGINQKWTNLQGTNLLLLLSLHGRKLKVALLLWTWPQALPNKQRTNQHDTMQSNNILNKTSPSVTSSRSIRAVTNKEQHREPQPATATSTAPTFRRTATQR